MNRTIIIFLCSFIEITHAHQLFSYDPKHTMRSYLLEITNHLKEKESRWYPFAIGFGQHANDAFFKNNQSKTVTEPLSHLFFAQSNFTPAQSLSSSSRTSKIAPLINTCIAPRISIKETGIVGGVQYSYAPKNNFQIGFRAHLPVVKIRTTKQTPGLSGKSLFGGAVVTDFYQTATDIVEGTATPVNDFAIRLDFLNTLPATLIGPGTTVSFVNYANSTSNTITMNGIDITDKQTTVTNRNPVTAVRVATNQTPTSPFGVLLDPSATPAPNTATTLPILSADGSNTDIRSRFDQTVNYQPLGQSTSHQSMLWIVPSVLAGSPAQLTQNATIIANNLKNIVRSINQSPEQIFQDNDISFADTTTTGIGDLAGEFFLDYFVNENTYAEFFCGISLPTGKKIDSKQNKIFASATASNGHTGLVFGINGLWKPSQWFSILSYNSIHSFLSAQEYIPVSFQGASVKNFNQLTPATKSWTTTTFGLDMYFHMPTHYKDSMITTLIFGYELSHKHKDIIHFVYPQMRDVTGMIQPTDNRVAAFETNRQAHTVSIKTMLTLFEKIHIFGGWHRVIHGLNTPKSTGWHIGIETYI
jgi:hypothetical protein